MNRRVLAGDRPQLATRNAQPGVILVAVLRGTYDDGEPFELIWYSNTLATNRTTEIWPSRRRLTKDGIVDAATAGIFSGGHNNRGATLVIMDMSSRTASQVLEGYAYSGHPVQLGMFETLGPGGGHGFLSWVSLAADIASVNVTRVLAATNAFRRIWGYAWYYNCSAVVATRTIAVSLRRPGLAVPTGFTSVGFVWVSPTDSLQTGEEGVLYLNGQYSSSNDNGTLIRDSTAIAPTPFPYDVTEDDLAELFFEVEQADAGDRHSIYLLQEEWVL